MFMSEPSPATQSRPWNLTKGQQGNVQQKSPLQFCTGMYDGSLFCYPLKNKSSPTIKTTNIDHPRLLWPLWVPKPRGQVGGVTPTEEKHQNQNIKNLFLHFHNQKTSLQPVLQGADNYCNNLTTAPHLTSCQDGPTSCKAAILTLVQHVLWRRKQQMFVKSKSLKKQTKPRKLRSLSSPSNATSRRLDFLKLLTCCCGMWKGWTMCLTCAKVKCLVSVGIWLSLC